MNIAQIENSLQILIQNYTKDTFIYELLLAYGLPKASITRLQKGNLNLSNIEGEISWKKKLFFKPVFNQDLHLAISEIKSTLKQDQRFVIVTDFKILLAIDTKTADSLDIDFTALPKHFDFFLPWAGMEKASHKKETEADVKAAERMAKLFDEIKKDNPDNSPEFIHGLNVFLSRLLFCYFAEDTGIFEKDLFTHSIQNHTQTDGSDLSTYLDKMFEVMNTAPNDRNTLPAYLDAFPYVNGGLFRNKHTAPIFSRRSRQAVLDSGEQYWAAINPDIFGSMIQAVITPEHRGGLGMHYTSVPNIMKVIEPLFLNDLYTAYENAKGNIKKLNDLLKRIWNIKLFDPACGSGNFLIIAYKELRRLEMLIFKEIDAVNKTYTTQYSGISLNHFYGIELDDFAHEIAILSLWLAEHQMNQEFFKAFGRTKPALPLQQTGSIVYGNATRIDWETVCPKNENDEIYILGNPPYLGARLQSDEQKSDMEFVFNKIKGFNNLDYISCWFLKGSNYIDGYNSQYSFVTTNSICQGEQVALLWPFLLKDSLEIGFAHTSFKWANNAKANAGVIVSIIGVRNKNSKLKFIYKDDLKLVVDNINSYLVNAKNTFIEKKSKPISKLPEMCFGSMANDGGNLFLNELEKENLISKYPEASKLIKKLVGAQEFIRGENKYCLWINDEDLELANQIPEITNRIEKCKQVRLSSKRENTNELASKSHQFAEIRFKETNSIIVPSVSSERREYIPMGYLDETNIIVAPNFAIYDAEPWILTLLTSKMHMSWIKSVCGRLKTDYRYSSSLGYNTFPFPIISDSQKEELAQCVFRILEERENHSEKTLAQMYDPEKMPEGLREAHRLNDLAVERCYRSKPFESDEERLEYLFKLYEKMIAEEKEKGTLFQEEKKAKKSKA
nr:DNA methyltransferase [uncultured Flavobacterium sp.]